jgi:hypothetical protein
MEAFCPSCGTKTEGNVRLGGSGDRNLTCDCGFSMRFYILHTQDKTDAEVEAIFQQTELTDSQRGTKRHSSHRKK